MGNFAYEVQIKNGSRTVHLTNAGAIAWVNSKSPFVEFTITPRSLDQLYRVMWFVLVSGACGHGEPLTQNVADSWVKHGNSEHHDTIKHWTSPQKFRVFTQSSEDPYPHYSEPVFYEEALNRCSIITQGYSWLEEDEEFDLPQ